MSKCRFQSKRNKWTRWCKGPLPQIRLTCIWPKNRRMENGCLCFYLNSFNKVICITNKQTQNEPVGPKTCADFLPLCLGPWKTQNVSKVYIRNRLSKYLIMSCLSSLNDDNIVTPIRKWPQMWCRSISIDRQITVVVLPFRHCPGPMHEGLNWEWMWLDLQSPSLNSHARNTNSSI